MILYYQDFHSLYVNKRNILFEEMVLGAIILVFFCSRAKDSIKLLSAIKIVVEVSSFWKEKCSINVSEACGNVFIGIGDKYYGVSNCFYSLTSGRHVVSPA